jgi:hypothetical protein
MAMNWGVGSSEGGHAIGRGLGSEAPSQESQAWHALVGLTLSPTGWSNGGAVVLIASRLKRTGGSHERPKFQIDRRAVAHHT